MVPWSAQQKRLSQRFPRASGDGPVLKLDEMTVLKFPPRERGWSLATPVRGRAQVVSPARAGMVRGQSRVIQQAVGFPRASGDGPSELLQLLDHILFPPRERGWSPLGHAGNLAASVSPARAGMVPAYHGRRLPASRFPRASGDGPKTLRSHAALYGFPRASGDGPTPLLLLAGQSAFPPRERGWSPNKRSFHHDGKVSPARAGMVPRRLPSPPARSGFPRASGDGPVTISHGGAMATFPPRERGWSLSCLPSNWSSAVSPARAGMVPGRQVQRARCIRFPRASGDGPQPAARLPG